jgi:hypothetical protein
MEGCHLILDLYTGTPIQETVQINIGRKLKDKENKDKGLLITEFTRAVLKRNYFQSRSFTDRIMADTKQPRRNICTGIRINWNNGKTMYKFLHKICR